ncbi:MAG TPA: MBL fold metallo-hydrolase [Rhizobium sp.]
MKITDGIHLVASGASGFDLTHPLDCNVFLLTDGREHHMFDAGAGLDAEAILAAMAAGGLDPAGLRSIFLTHGHADHSGGVVPLQKQIAGLTVVAGQATAGILTQDDERLISLDRARGRVYPMDYVWRTPRVDRILENGESMMTGPFRVTLHETPGHSEDHCCYTVQADGISALVGGDAVFADGKIVLQDIEDCSVSKSLASIRALAELDFDQFLPGHGRFSLKDGKRHVLAAKVFADAGLPPPQL